MPGLGCTHQFNPDTSRGIPNTHRTDAEGTCNMTKTQAMQTRAPRDPRQDAQAHQAAVVDRRPKQKPAGANPNGTTLGSISNVVRPVTGGTLSQPCCSPHLGPHTNGRPSDRPHTPNPRYAPNAPKKAQQTARECQGNLMPTTGATHSMRCRVIR